MRLLKKSLARCFPLPKDFRIKWRTLTSKLFSISCKVSSILIDNCGYRDREGQSSLMMGGGFDD